MKEKKHNPSIEEIDPSLIPYDERDMVERWASRFSESKINECFTIQCFSKYRKNIARIVLDMVLLHNDIPYVVVEIIRHNTEDRLKRSEHQLNFYYNSIEFRFGVVICDSSEEIFVSDFREQNGTKFKKLNSVNELLDLILNSIDIERNSKGFIRTQDLIEKIDQEFEEKFDKKKLDSNVVFDNASKKFFFKKEEFENFFFYSLLQNGDDVSISRFYRYTSLQTFMMLIQHGVYRMSGLVGMNDSSECYYFDKIYNGKTSEVSFDPNIYFISSGSSKKDDLTMWRLYGQDGRGVCLELEINNELPLNLQLSKVSYGESGGTKPIHKLIDSIRTISEFLVFKNLEKWKPFFKPFEYGYEDEIRLLFKDNRTIDNGVVNREWILSKDFSIAFPVVDLKLNTKFLPISIKKVILGPKLEEHETNEDQIKYMCNQYGLEIEIENSSITNYR